MGFTFKVQAVGYETEAFQYGTARAGGRAGGRAYICVGRCLREYGGETGAVLGYPTVEGGGGGWLAWQRTRDRGQGTEDRGHGTRDKGRRTEDRCRTRLAERLENFAMPLVSEGRCDECTTEISR